ncbi:MAG: hypothetical protein KTR31_04860 [Myxococcales bacterium]|nr:hypothetical protein [Myxococcales bacterium]
MRTIPLWAALIAVPTGCKTDPLGGTQIGALREDPPPVPPTDFKQLDIAQAVRDAFAVGGTASMASAWAAHVASMQRGSSSCPTMWLGPPDEDLVDINFGNDDAAGGLSWIDQCQTLDGDVYRGFAYWNSTIDVGAGQGERVLVMDGVIRDTTGALLLDFDGETTDQLDGNRYQSDFVARTLSGSLVGFGSGLRAELESSWGAGELEMVGSVHVNDGFGPADTRNPEVDDVPELANLPSWRPGMPRYTSVRYDLQVDGDCALEPRGYIGIRGNEGFWFDVYFLPLYDAEEDPARASAFPFEAIDNLECDGVGTLFVRNLDLREEEAADPDFDREITIDFGAIIAALPTPSLDGYVFTLQDLPEDTP